MKLKKFNLIASASAFALGTIYMFSDAASITANVVGSSGSSAGFTSIMGIFMIFCSIALFIVSMHGTIDDHNIDIERHFRRGNSHHHIDGNKKEDSEEEV